MLWLWLQVVRPTWRLASGRRASRAAGGLLPGGRGVYTVVDKHFQEPYVES